jgi:ATP-dependent exoDNAse (exonuclease V) alpha subunit
MDLPELRDSWLARAAEIGLGAPELRGLLDREPAGRQAPAIHIEELTARQTTVTTPELVRAVAGAEREGMAVADILATVEQLARRSELTRVGDEASPGRPARFSTTSLLELEREAIGVALDGRNAGAPVADSSALAAALDEAPFILSDEQRVLVEEAALSPDRIVCAVGAAGAGKTTALHVLGDALSRSGVPVFGGAPSGRAADELERGADIPSQTLHSLLNDARHSGGLPPGCVLVIDEAGMAETRVLAPVLALVEQAGGKALLVGDPAQLPSVGAGGLHRALGERLGAVALEENHRQREVAEREALARLREGDAESYLTHAAQAGRLQIADDAITAKAHLLADWWQAASAGAVRDAVMLALRRADVAELNEGARALMRQAGRLGERALVAGEREFRPGDRVVCRRNDAQLGARNGMLATVRAVEQVLGIVTLQIDCGRSLQLPERYVADDLEHGYALTGHAAQGLTIDRAFVLVRTEGALAEWGYVVASRARDETRIYAVSPELTDDAAHARSDGATVRGLAGALSRTAGDQPALEQAEGQRHEAPPRQVERLRHELDLHDVRLGAAERELSRLGWFGREPRHTELRQAIGVERRALRELRAELRIHAPEDVRVSSASTELTRAATHDGLTRHPPQRGMSLGR